MWIVRLALRRPYTFVVAALVLLLLTPFVLLNTPTDIFPSINIPVISVIWQYAGLDAQEIEQRIIYAHERALTSTVQGVAVPWPYGGKTRVVSVDLDLPALKSRSLTAQDVVNAINAQNLIFPSGTAKIGTTEFDVELNASPKVLKELNDLPIRSVN